MNILFFGDISGKIGRRAVASVLPGLKKKYQPDVIIANADNVTHGNGINETHLNYLREQGIDIFTAGDHTLRRPQTRELLTDKEVPVLRPANTENAEGEGAKVFEIGEKKLLVISLLGRTFIDENIPSPFVVLKEILHAYNDKVDAILVDFHAEATSEKAALPWYIDGKVTAVLGTHTHVQTADERILPGGTAVITDVGFCGARDSVIGVDKDEIINHFLTGGGFRMNIPEYGDAQVNAVYIQTAADGKATTIERINTIVKIT